MSFPRPGFNRRREECWKLVSASPSLPSVSGWVSLISWRTSYWAVRTRASQLALGEDLAALGTGRSPRVVMRPLLLEPVCSHLFFK